MRIGSVESCVWGYPTESSATIRTGPARTEGRRTTAGGRRSGVDRRKKAQVTATRAPDLLTRRSRSPQTPGIPRFSRVSTALVEELQEKEVTGSSPVVPTGMKRRDAAHGADPDLPAG